MKTIIGKFNPKAGTVPVTFEHNGATHKRDVNACRDTAGKYDKTATAERVAQVAAGVQHKIEIGVNWAADRVS